MLSRITVLLWGAAFAAFLAAPAVGQNAENPSETTAQGTAYVPGEIAVRLEDGSYETRPVAADSLGEIEAEAEDLETEAGVESAGPNFVYELEQAIDEPGEPVGVVEPSVRAGVNVAPDDDFYVTDLQQNLLSLKLPKAWEETRGTGVRVAVVDSGWYRAHPELKDDVVAEYDFVDEDGIAAAAADPFFSPHHGTQVGGIAAGETNNGRGVAAAGWAATVMEARACAGLCSSVDTAPAVDWARRNGADVINLSFGAFQTPPGDSLLGAAVQRALNDNIVVVASAGNSGISGDNYYPAAYSGVLGVGSSVTSSPPTVSTFSNQGAHVDVVAPSEVMIDGRVKGIIMPCNLNVAPERLFCRQEGTSFSTPQVTGIAALVRAYSPGLTQAQVVARIRGQADDIAPAGRDDASGYGEADAKCSVLPSLSGC